MSITQAGPQCDVCGNYIFPGDHMNWFTVEGIKESLHSHDKCKAEVLAAMSDWKALPEGPLRRVFERSTNQPC